MKKFLFSFLLLVIITKVQSQCPGAGTISFQRWNNITGGAVSNLTSNTNYPNTPTSSGSRSLFEMQQNLGNNLGIRMFGYICPPVTGNYVFWIASNNSGELWLSTSSSASDKVRIAYNTSGTASREWNLFSTQKSVSIALTAGEKYYVEALMKESTGNDNLAVGWAKPGQSTSSPSEVIPGSSLSVNSNTDGQAPSVPTGLNATNISTSSFTLSWSAATDNVAVTGYDVYRGTVKLNTTNITTLSYNVTGLSPNTAYSMTVRAKDAGGNQSVSIPLPVTTSPDTQAPSAPTNLSAANITISSFTLSWTAATDNVAVSGYNVYRNGVKLNTSNITATSFNVTGLSPNTTYTMTVRSKDAAGNQTPSTPLSVKTIPDTQAPSAPSGLNATNLTTTSFTLSWTAATDNVAVTGYDVYSNGVKLNTTNITGVSYNVTGLSPNTAYSMTVKAKDAAANEATSSPLSVTTNDIPDTEAPSAPSGLNATNLTTTAFTLSWSAATDNVAITGYDVYRGAVKVNTTNITSTSFDVTGLSPNTAYSMTVKAKDAAANEATSNPLSVTTNDIPDTEAPSAPSGLNATNLTTTSFTLSWTAATDNVAVTGYDVYRGAVKVNTTIITSTSFDATGLSPNTAYSMTVRAKDAAANEATSNPLSVTTNDIPDTEAPSAPTGLNSTNLTTTSFTLSWSAAIDNVAVTGYDVYSNGVKLNTTNITGVSYNVTGLSPNTAYSMTVKAKDAAVNEATSNPLSVITNDIPDTEAPSAPTNLNATNITTSSFTLSWSAATDNVAVTGYDVYRGAVKVNTTNITSTSFGVTGLSPNTAYSMTVRAKDAAANEATSNPLSVTTNDIPDTEAPLAPTNLNSTNLTTTSFTLSWTAAIDNVAVTGYDVYRGAVKVNTTIISSTSFDVTGLSPNTAYSMTVKAKDAAANEATSSSLSVTTNDIPDTEAPSAPTNLAAATITTTSFTLSWSAATDNIGVTGYDVYRDGLKLNASNITGISYNVTGLSPNTAYSMTVKAKDAAANEATSNPLSVTTNDIPDTEAPSAPTGLNATSITTTSFTLSWSAATDNVAVTGYDVYSNGVKLNTTNITGVSYNVTGLSPNTAYSMTVKAKDAAANEATSNPLSVTTNDIPDTENPSAPTNLNATNITTSSFTLSWTAATDNVAVTGYDVYSGALKLNAAIITATSFDVTGLSPNTAYSMTVKAKDAAANESTSNPLSVTTNDIPDTEAPSAPTNLNATNITINSFTLSWTAATDNVAVTGYDVYSGALKLNAAIITATSFDVTGLSPNTAYSMTVKAKDAAANEATSNPLSVTTNDIPDTEAPSVPSGLNATSITTTSFTLSWTAATDNIAVTGYDVYGNGVKLNTTNITGVTYNVPGLSPNTAYSMTVKAKDAAANKATSNPLSVTTNDIPDTEAPSVPSGLNATSITTTSFTLSWTAATDNVAVTGYDVYSGSLKLNAAFITATSFDVTGLSPNTAYSMTVRAKDAAANEATSNPLSVTTNDIPDTENPSAPTNLNATNITTSSFTLSWTAATDNVAVTGYDVYSGALKLNAAIITATSFDVTGLSPNTAYSMTVKAKDAAANESTSNPLSVTTNDIPDTEAPSAPTNLNATNITINSFTLSWTAATDNVAVTGYDVYSGALKLNATIITATSFDVTGLSPNTAYSMTVKAKDAAANEATSNPLSVTTNDIPDTEAPSVPSGLNATSITTTSFTLSWTAATDNIAVTGYDVYGNGVKLNTTNITGVTYNVTGLSLNTAYSMTVKAKDAAANESTSNPLSVTTNDIPDTEAPSAPTGLNATTITTTSFTLSWTAATDNVAVTGYDVYSNGVKLNTANIIGASYNVTGLSPSTAYSMTVKAKDAAANEATSNPLSVTTNDIPDTEAPSAPSGLNATTITTTSFTLSWTAATDNVAVTGYDVYSNGVKLNTANITGVSYNVTGLSPNTAYSMTVKAKDAAANEATSNPLSVTTNDIPDTEAPSAPTNLNATNITTSSFTLSWSAATDNVAVTGYDVYKDAVKVNTTNITSTSFDVTGLSPNTAYSMTVKAKDAAANEATSNPLSVTTNDIPDTEAPSAPTNLSATNITINSFTLSWTAATDNIAVTRYDVYSGALKLNAAIITATSFDVTGLSPNTAYSMTVRAKDAAANESTSNPLSVTTNDIPDTEAPSAPTNLNATNITTSSFTLSWTAATDNVAITGYDVYSNGVKLNTTNISGVSYNVTGLSPNTAYSMTVRAKDAAANESTSNPLSVTTNDIPDTEAPSAPTNLNATNITINSFTLSWTAATDNVAVTGYDVYSGALKLNAAIINATSFDVTGLSPNTAYSMTVRAKDAAANESTSNPLSVTTNDIPDTEAPSAPTNLNATNITTSSFTLSWTAATDNVAITGYDVYSNGVKLNTTNISGVSYNVTGLSPNTAYSMTVKAKDAAANEATSNSLSVTTNDIPDTEAPSVPSGLNANTITTNSFTLSWTAATDNVAVTGYDVYSNGVKLNTTNISGASYNVTGLLPNTAYSTTVRAKDAAANEATSNPLSVTTNDIPDTEAPSAPTNLSATNITINSFTLSWTAATDNIAVTRYDVYSGALKLNAAIITATSFDVTGLSPNTAYSMTVRAKDAAANESTSNPVSVTTNDIPDTETPSAPTNLNATNITINSFTLSWTAATDNIAVTGYDVYSNGVTLNTANITGVSYNVTDLAPNTAYSMTVRARDAANNLSNSSTALSITTLVPPPASPILTLTLAPARILDNQSNVIIENLRFENITGVAINIFSSSNITIRNCFFNRATEEAISVENSNNIIVENCLFNGVQTGVYVLKSQIVKVRNNQFINVRMRPGGSRGQFVQFNEVTGAGNLIENNKGENFPGESDPEDLISLYKCVGTSASYISVRNNMFRGGGPSTSGSGIVAGDNGGRYMVIENNTLLDPGQAGIAVASGRNINILNNKIYARQQPWTNNPLYVWNQSATTCSNITVTGNRVNWTDMNGVKNNGWNAGNCSSTVFEAPTTITLAEMNVPYHLISFVTEAELLMIRGSLVENKQAKGSIAFNRIKRNPLNYQFLYMHYRDVLNK